jgi:flagellar biosynthesis anti-sigma factor FlgM
MKIEDAYAAGSAGASQPAATPPGKTEQPGAVAPSEAKGEAAAGAAREPDQVQLSDLTERLAKLLGPESPDRAARLERLAAEVQSGRYHVDTLAVSRRLVDEALGGA